MMPPPQPCNLAMISTWSFQNLLSWIFGSRYREQVGLYLWDRLWLEVHTNKPWEFPLLFSVYSAKHGAAELPNQAKGSHDFITRLPIAFTNQDFFWKIIEKSKGKTRILRFSFVFYFNFKAIFHMRRDQIICITHQGKWGIFMAVA